MRCGRDLGRPQSQWPSLFSGRDRLNGNDIRVHFSFDRDPLSCELVELGTMAIQIVDFLSHDQGIPLPGFYAHTGAIGVTHALHAVVRTAHRGAPGGTELDRIFRLESERVVSEDGVVRYANRYLQLGRRSGVPAQSKVRVCEGRHGNLAVEYRGRALRWKEIAAPIRPAMANSTGACVRVALTKRKWVPPEKHPWREAARRAAQQKAMRETPAAPPSLAWPSASP